MLTLKRFVVGTILGVFYAIAFSGVVALTIYFFSFVVLDSGWKFIVIWKWCYAIIQTAWFAFDLYVTASAFRFLHSYAKRVAVPLNKVEVAWWIYDYRTRFGRSLASLSKEEFLRAYNLSVLVDRWLKYLRV